MKVAEKRTKMQLLFNPQRINIDRKLSRISWGQHVKSGRLQGFPKIFSHNKRFHAFILVLVTGVHMYGDTKINFHSRHTLLHMNKNHLTFYFYQPSEFFTMLEMVLGMI